MKNSDSYSVTTAPKSIILICFLKECTETELKKTGCTVKKVSKVDLFVIETTSGKYVSSSLVSSNGREFPIPKMGATGFP